MDTSVVSLAWTDNMNFVGNIEGYQIQLGATLDPTTEPPQGTSPKKLLLLGLGGCTAMDVVSLLAKMRVVHTAFTITVEAAQSQEHPKVYTAITLTYRVEGAQPDDRAKIEKAINLSLERYCGVAAMLGKTATIDYRLELA